MLRKRKILVVDDDPIYQKIYGRVLDESGYEVESFEDSSEGLMHLEFEYHSIDLVVLDLKMPGISGIQFLFRKLHMNPKLQNVPVIVVSSFSDEIEWRQLVELGAKGFLKKPFDPNTICQSIEYLLEEEPIKRTAS